MNDTTVRGPKSSAFEPRAKLVRMLRSMLRSWPQARLIHTSGGFGALLDDRTYIQIAYSGHWTAEDMRDLLALFAIWLVADPDRLLGGGARLDGVLQTVQAESDSYSGRQG
jgi:hypothetical protein